jgi:hypothetical protein
MNRELARKVADAVLYEGYMLYPYRPSAIKNRQRWGVGILYPPEYSEVRGGTERSGMHIECLLHCKENARLQLELRFLQSQMRQVYQTVDGRLQPVPSLIVNGQLFETWDEAIARSVELELDLPKSLQKSFDFDFSASHESEMLRNNTGEAVGDFSRTQHEINGTLEVTVKRVQNELLKITINVENTTPLKADAIDRDVVLLRSLLSAHVVLAAGGGKFVSLLDPPEAFTDAVKRCRNIGNFPVLLGLADEREMMLASPILLYDHPQIAPESAGDFYDATEMDEMLTLRVLTLADAEKDEMRVADNRVRALLERTEHSAREQLRKTHGAIRGMSPVREKQ